MLRFLKIVILVICTALFATFSVSNRETVALSFFPLPYDIELPKFLLVLLAVLFGALLASLFTGLTLFRNMLERFRNRRKIAALKNEVEGLRIEKPAELPRSDAA